MSTCGPGASPSGIRTFATVGRRAVALTGCSGGVRRLQVDVALGQRQTNDLLRLHQVQRESPRDSAKATQPGYNPMDLDRLLKLRLIVARHGEMDLGKWWDTNGVLGPRGVTV